jgi:glutamyl-tRNA synthetase
MILGADGERLVQAPRVGERGAGTSTKVSCPEALLNYLARLGWSHGDDELFDAADGAVGLDLGHVSHSPPSSIPEKALWMNQQYIKGADDARLATLLKPFSMRSRDRRWKSRALVKDRAHTLVQLADAARIFYAYEAADTGKIPRWSSLR